jgi:hypothetical protein
VGVLALPPGFAEKIAFGLARPGAPAPPPPAHAIDARIGDVVRVLGWDGPDVAAPGAEIEVVTHLVVDRRPDAGWRPFFHLEGPGGNRNLDHVPLEGTLPIERWRAGQRLRDRLRFALPATAPPGSYTLYLGFWRGNQRLPVSPASASDGHDRLRLGAVIVP